MLTNEEFISKLEHKIYMARPKKVKSLCELNHSKSRIKKQLLLDAIEKDRLNVVVPVDTEEKFYRSNYTTICTSGGINIRCRRFKEYYCISDTSIQELREREFKQMLKHLEAYLKISRKGFLLFIRNYVVVDEVLLYDLIKHITTTPQQAYKKRVQWQRLKEEMTITRANIFQELESMKPAEKNHIKQMYEYNKKIYKKYS